MAELGSVFETIDDEDVPSGPDLRVSIEVPRAALGHGFRAAVPRRLAAGTDIVERVSDPEDPDHVVVHLPPQLPSGVVLRLRGQGGLHADPEGRAGDLHAVVELVDRPLEPVELIGPDGVVAVHEGAPLAPREGIDRTWLVLLALLLVAGGVLLALAL